jgi:hypothetical protein
MSRHRNPTIRVGLIMKNDVSSSKSNHLETEVAPEGKRRLQDVLYFLPKIDDSKQGKRTTPMWLGVLRAPKAPPSPRR